MKNFLVHVHIYYPNLWSELSNCLNSIRNYSFKLVITLVNEDFGLIQTIKNEWPSAEIIVVKNQGFDLGPFIYVLNSEDLSKYSYIIKLHTKRDIPARESFFWFAGPKWRNSLLNFIRSPESFERVLKRFNSNPKLGMHGPSLSTFCKLTDDNIPHKATDDFIISHGYKTCRYKFVAGTMFMVRSELFQKVKELNLSFEDFEKPDLSHEGCQLAHILERFCGYIVTSQGYTIEDCASNYVVSKFVFFLLILRKFTMKYFFTIRITKKNKLLIKILKIPVFSMQLRKKI